MRVIVALGGNALLRRDEPLTVENQRRNVKLAAAALAPVAAGHELLISHGNGPQVGLLALQGLAYNPDEASPLDVLDAQTQGMIGYLIEQELSNVLPSGHHCATLLTRIEVDPSDPAFENPTKPIGPTYTEAEALALAEARGWTVARDGESYRRVVPSPKPLRIQQLDVIESLVSRHVVVICAGGGGIPTVRTAEGTQTGVEAVIDKDLASGLLARELDADALVMLTDVDAVYTDWGRDPRAIRRISPQRLRDLDFEAGSMAPKVRAASEFVEASGGIAAIGHLEDAPKILRGEAGTIITDEAGETTWWGRSSTRF
jgi:carbamate kinase